MAKLIKYACENSTPYKSKGGWIAAHLVEVSSEELKEITGINDLHQLDRELDHLRSLELITSGFHHSTTVADITPHALCLQLYVRSQGYVGSPINYFGATHEESSNN